MRVIAAPDTFKGSISAAAAAAAIASGWHDVRPGDEVAELPLADGGEGTMAVLAGAVPGSRWHQADVRGPGADQVAAAWLELPGQIAVIELAAAAGLTQLARPRPMTAHSYGVGQLIAAALAAGASEIVLGLGGSACTDGGTGALAALGARFLDASGTELPLGGGALRRLATADLTGLTPPPARGCRCLTDVRSPLLGPDGAAAVFGPQKGAGPNQIAALESGLRRLASVLGGRPGEPGAGAAGGCGYGFAAGWAARLVPGAAELAVLAGLPAALAGADLLITGEGQYDVTSEQGKVVGAVRALAAGVPVAIVAGRVATSPPAGVRAVELSALAEGEQRAMAEPARWLAEAGALLARSAESR